MHILDPLDQYNSTFKEEFREKTAQCFEDLVKASKIDEAANVATVKQYNETMENKRSYEKKLTSCNVQKGFGIFFIIVGFAAAIVGLLDLVGALEIGLGTTIDALMLVLGILMGVGIILVICLSLNKRIHELQGIVNDLHTKALTIQAEAYEQMRPLNNLFSYDVTAKLIHEVLPMVNINRYMDDTFNDSLVQNYGFSELNEVNKSTLNVLSGTFYNAPFVTENNLIHEMGVKTYFGSITISWTETYEDDEGHTHTRTRTQVLTAEVVKPFPEYHQITSTMLLSDATPSLIFSRDPKLEGDESERELDRIIRKGEKKINKLAGKALENGDDFTGLNNSEFDVLFDALDRNDEKAFSLMFSPAAQSNLTKIIKSKEPFGDDFYYHKNGKFNVIMSEHMQGYDIDFDENKFKSFDINASRKLFNEYNNDFFAHFYFELAPLMAIPLIQDYAQQQKPVNSNDGETTSIREATALANHIASKFAPSDADTLSILKLQRAGSDGNLDKYIVNAYAYRGEPRVDLVPRRGGDGRIHQVPVPWVEYVNTSRQTAMWVKDLWRNTVEKNAFLANNSLESAFGIDSSSCVTNNGLLGFTNGYGSLSEGQRQAFSRITHSENTK